MAETLHFEDLQVGQRWLSPARTITADDVTDFAELTGDHTPLHASNAAGESSSPFGRPVAHGLLGLSVLAGLSSEHPRVQTLALVSLGNWEFRRPLYFGDTVHVETEIVDLEPHGRRAGRVTWHRRLISAAGQILQEGSLVTLVAARTAHKRKPQPVGVGAKLNSYTAASGLPKVPTAASHPR
ncbi:MaoC/PaaZ C-terminal domain-containing protein [Candidatus Laterigemmans baculatus]|uniref:MaoC/PaaZ C-terminal domain-containing protein n=1 Tax=Candidatus Laterigemmans baculatus TaxID=2770505 RepID=UPI0013DA2DB9|nr:MaoC/PaaZ C-terminal domain-containing protein [Candidatus Laterigemmans baculatus]